MGLATTAAAASSTTIATQCCCPACHAALSELPSRLACGRCSVLYPVIDHAAVLVPQPQHYLAHQALMLEHTLHMWRRQRAQLAAPDETGTARALVAARVTAALDVNLAIGRDQLRSLVGALDVHDLLTYVTQRGGGRDKPGRDVGGSYGLGAALSHLQTDWARTPEGEAQIAAIETLLFRYLDRCRVPRDAAVVLGAGTGRYVVDLADRFGRVIGAELSLSPVDLFYRAAAGPVRFAEINLSQPVSAESITCELVAEIPAASRPRPGAVEMVVADARRLPLPAASQSAAISIYFSDVVPLEPLLREVSRILAPGGCFVSIGPLHYHFDDLNALLTPEEARDTIERHGFTVEAEEWTEMANAASPRRGLRSIYRLWTFVARKRAAGQADAR